MPSQSSVSYDVVIAGAGPVGLFLALELRLAGLSVLALEQAEDPRSPLKRLPFGLRGLSIPTLEAFDRRGLLDDVARPQGATDQPRRGAHWEGQARRAGGHFAGIQFFHDKVDASQWRYRLPGPAAGALAVEMERLETVLAARALETGVEIKRGFGVEGFDQTNEGVTVRARGEEFSAKWLVGCDGGRSLVRKVGGFGFAGTEPELTGYSVLIGLADADCLKPGRHYTPTGMYTYQKPGVVAMVDFDGGAFHRRELTREHIEAVLRKISGVEVSVTALEQATTWTDRAFQAGAYRKGRALLAGDAAHVHSPLGGQGLNLGLGDAMNLGWKLAATIRGDAPEGLLDTYFAERAPVDAQILDWSRNQFAVMRPSPASRALEAVLRDLIETRDGATYFAERVWGVSLRYDLGGAHPLVGRSAPDFTLADGTRLGERLRAGGGLLLDFAPGAPLHAVAGRWRGRVDYLASDARDRLGLSALLVRPDGCVAWASDDPGDPEDAARAMSRWFGRPK